MKTNTGQSVSAAGLYRRDTSARLDRQMAMRSSQGVLFSLQGVLEGTYSLSGTLPGQNTRKNSDLCRRGALTCGGREKDARARNRSQD